MSKENREHERTRKVFKRLQKRVHQLYGYVPLTDSERDSLDHVSDMVTFIHRHIDEGVSQAKVDVIAECLLEFVQGILDDMYRVADLWRNNGPEFMLDAFEDIRFPACVIPPHEFLDSKESVKELADMRKELDLRVLSAESRMRPPTWERIGDKENGVEIAARMALSIIHVNEQVENGFEPTGTDMNTVDVYILTEISKLN